MKCENCGFENVESAKFCKQCGSALATEQLATENAAGQAVAENATENVAAEAMAENATENAAGEAVAENVTENVAGEAVTENATENAAGQAVAENATENVAGEAVAENAPDKELSKKEKKAAKKAEKKAAKEQKKAGKEKKKKSLIVAWISTLLCIGLIVAVIFEAIWYNRELDNLQLTLDKANADMESSVDSYEGKLAQKQEKIDTLEGDIESLNNKISLYEQDLESYANYSDYYAYYDDLIEYSNEISGQGTDTFFCSDTVMHIDREGSKIYIYVDENTDMSYDVENTDVALCDWSGWIGSNVAVLNVNPGRKRGNTKVTITNEKTEAQVVVFLINK